MSLTLLLPTVLPKWNVVKEEIVLEGYQMYAVDNWILARNHVPILVVHTGDVNHKITVSSISPPSQAEWEETLSLLKRHAKSKETQYGTLLVTSLAQFRSDYTIVPIPGGNLESAKKQLHTNINLLRMGCSGRSGLTLEEPSYTTKDRFISTYSLPDNHLSGAGKAPVLFNDTVLELVKLVQVSLYIFGYYPTVSFDGLLCDTTVKGLKLWVEEIGDVLIEGVEPMERTADPSIVAGLLSLILAVRNRLAALSGSTTTIPKDPFLHPRLFTRALAAYSTTSNPSPHLSYPFLTPSPLLASTSSKGSSNTGSHSPRQSISHSILGGSSPHFPAPSMPVFLKDHLANLAHANGSGEPTHSYAQSLPLVPTIHTHPSLPTNHPAHSPPTTAPNTARMPHTTLSADTMGGVSTPTLALTLPTPPASGFHSPNAISPANSTHSAMNAINDAADTANTGSASNSDHKHTDAVYLTRSLIENVFSTYDAKLLRVSPEARRAARKEKKAIKDRKKDSVSNMDIREEDGKEGLSSIAGLPGVAAHSHLLSTGSLPLPSGLKTGLTSGLTGTLTSTLTGGGTHPGAASILMPVADLEELITVIVGEMSSYRKHSKEERKEKKERDLMKGREKGERKEREKEVGKERERRAAEHSSSSSSSSEGIVDLSKAAKKVKAKVKSRTIDKDKERNDPEKDYDGEHRGYKRPYKKQSKDKEDLIGGVGGLVRGLWTGRVGAVVKLRQRTEDRERERRAQLYEMQAQRDSLARDRERTERDGAVISDGVEGSWRSQASKSPSSRYGLWSDGDTDSTPYLGAKPGKRKSLPTGDSLRPSFSRRASVTNGSGRGRYGSLKTIPSEEKSDGRSTEEEGLGHGTETFGALWAKSGSKVRGKLESWTGLSKFDKRVKTHSSLGKLDIPSTFVPSGDSNVVDLSPTASPLGSPTATSPPQILNSPHSSPSAPKRSYGAKLLLPAFRSVSPSQSQAQLGSQPQSPLWMPDDDDDLLSSGQVSPVGYGSGYTLGFESGIEDPRTPKAWPTEYFDGTRFKLGSPFSGSRSSVEGPSTDRKRGSEASANTHYTDSSRAQDSEYPNKGAGAAYSTLGKGFPTKRPWPANRIPHASRVSSWSDPVSARDDVQVIANRNDSDSGVIDEGQESEDRLSRDEEMQDGDDDAFAEFSARHRRSSTAKQNHPVDAVPHSHSQRHSQRHRASPTPERRKSTLGRRSAQVERFGSAEPSGESFDRLEEDGGTTRRLLGLGPRRRRSFHSLTSYRHENRTEDPDDDFSNGVGQMSIKVLPVDRMRIDVELCGQYLIMWRREEHLRNVISTLQILNFRLEDTNAHMREHQESHRAELDEIQIHTKIIAEVDLENANADKISQGTNTLRYEAEQFRVPDLWHIASPPRQNVLAMREKMFGMGGRRYPQGVHGANGRFNRVQWTLDGKERLVDSEGKTESEVEEEMRIDAEGVFISLPKEDVEDVVEHPSIKPMWLLRFFTRWVNWGSSPISAVAKVESTQMQGREASPNGQSPTATEQPQESSAPSEPVKVEKAASM